MQKKKVIDSALLPQHYHQYTQDPASYILSYLPHQDTINIPNFTSLVLEIQSMYKQDSDGVYYHNLTHAFDVMTVMDQFLTHFHLPLRMGLETQDRIWILLAAYAHDNGHEGFDNSYYINNNHPLALQYSYMSPLEHMHSSNLMKLLHKYQINIPLQKKKMIVGMILSTDNLHHQRKVTYLQHLHSQMNKNQTQTLVKNKQLVLQSLLHAADINSPSKEPILFDRWNYKICQQFENQKKIQNKELYQISTKLQTVQQQKAFINNFVLPFYRQLAHIFPEADEYVEKINKNYIRICEKEQEEEKGIIN